MGAGEVEGWHVEGLPGLRGPAWERHWNTWEKDSKGAGRAQRVGLGLVRIEGRGRKPACGAEGKRKPVPGAEAGVARDRRAAKSLTRQRVGWVRGEPGGQTCRDDRSLPQGGSPWR